MRLNQSHANLGYDRSEVTSEVMNIGIGAFLRAHGAARRDDFPAADPIRGVIGVSIRRPDTDDALAPLGLCYTVAVRDAEGTSCRKIGPVRPAHL